MAIACVPKIPYSFSESADEGALLLSSTNLNFDIVYMLKYYNAIITKSIMFEIKSPHKNFDLPIVNDIALRSPGTKKRPINGVMMPLNIALTSLEASCPITMQLPNQ
jgi:hypothetical protein